jgi:dTMP kinase
MKKGIFIVIEGTDGSGKATQTKLLTGALKKAGYKLAQFDFPQYFKSSSDFVKAYLQGRYGSIKEVSPHKASLLYALDRFEAAPDIKAALKAGKVVLANRYVGSNMGHQGAKIKSQEDRLKYFMWDMELEYGILEIPKPDVNVILRVPARIAQKLVDKKRGKERFYTKGKKRDIHEASLSHLKKAEETYTEMARYFPKQFTLVDCAPKGELLPIADIAGKILKIVKRKL